MDAEAAASRRPSTPVIWGLSGTSFANGGRCLLKSGDAVDIDLCFSLRDPSMSCPTPAEIAAMTPMMRQYWELKQRCGEAILFFRMGDFFEIFGADAELVAPLLELTLTSRERGDQRRIPFCGVPHHSARNYWLKLLRKGFKVAFADQIEDPAEAKGLVKRDITRTLTPGCVDDPDALDRDAPNYIAAAHEEPGSGMWAVAIADVSTGELRLGNVSSLAEVVQTLESFRPREVLTRGFFHSELKILLQPLRESQTLLLEPLPEAPLRDKAEQTQILSDVFGTPDLTAQPCGAVVGGAPLMTALLVHFRSLHASTSQFLSVRPLHEPQTMILDETAVRDLELFETARRRDSDGSLLKEIDRTLSPMGARLLRYTLAHPLLDPQQIRGRHAAVRSLLGIGETRLTGARTQLKHLPDLERLATRVTAATAGPVELSKIAQALVVANWLVEHLIGAKGEHLPEAFYKTLATGLKFYKSPLQVLTQALLTDPQGLGLGSGVFAAGYDAELDRLNELARNGEAQVEAYQEQLRLATGIGSLKIKNHKSYGLLIEITRTHTARVPADFIRRQTMVNGDRFITVALQELGESLASAQDNAVAREADLFSRLLLQLGEYRVDLRSVAHALASFDLLQSFAWQALKFNYCEPLLADDDCLDLKASRHPVVERYVGRHKYCANDIAITPQKKHLLITGPNMAGKSTLMRQTALTVILCQIGSYVPANSARLPVFDRIFTRVGASDDLARGQSTFMVEMSEAAHLLRHATPKSLVILDEVGRGTSTRDGLAIAAAILQDLAIRIRCYSLFATHYHELIPVAALLPTVRPMQTEVLEQNNQILFTHRLKEGAVDNSYGLEVARLAGIPETVLKRAATYLLQNTSSAGNPPEIQERAVQGASVHAAPSAETTPPAPLERLGLAPAPALVQNMQHQEKQVLERLSRLQINRLSPLQGLNILSELQATLERATVNGLFPEESC